MGTREGGVKVRRLMDKDSSSEGTSKERGEKLVTHHCPQADSCPAGPEQWLLPQGCPPRFLLLNVSYSLECPAGQFGLAAQPVPSQLLACPKLLAGKAKQEEGEALTL